MKKLNKRVFQGINLSSELTLILTLGLIFLGFSSTAFAAKSAAALSQLPGYDQKAEQAKLPPAVAQAVKQFAPGEIVDKVEAEKKGDITIYDLEFQGGKMEMEVAEDGTVLDISRVIATSEIPAAVSSSLTRLAASAQISQVEKSEVRAEIQKHEGKIRLVKYAAPKYVYEAELIKGNKKGEVVLSPDGKVVEGLKWGDEEEEEKEKKEINKEKENEEANEAEENEENEERETATSRQAAAADLKILPPAVLKAFQSAYPEAVIKKVSKETEKGITYYEIESLDGKLQRDLLYTADGQAVEIEESLNPGDLPEAVTESLKKNYPGAEIIKAEKMTKDKQSFFELQIKYQGKKKSITLTPGGQIVK